jgi:hypothetical protein
MRASGGTGCGNISEGWRLRLGHCKVWRQDHRVGGEEARGRGETARRSAMGGRGNKPICMVPKAEVVRLSVIPLHAPRRSQAVSFLRAFRTRCHASAPTCTDAVPNQVRAPIPAAGTGRKSMRLRADISDWP